MAALVDVGAGEFAGGCAVADAGQADVELAMTETLLATTADKTILRALPGAFRRSWPGDSTNKSETASRPAGQRFMTGGLVVRPVRKPIRHA